MTLHILLRWLLIEILRWRNVGLNVNMTTQINCFFLTTQVDLSTTVLNTKSYPCRVLKAVCFEYRTLWKKKKHRKPKSLTEMSKLFPMAVQEKRLFSNFDWIYMQFIHPFKNTCITANKDKPNNLFILHLTALTKDDFEDKKKWIYLKKKKEKKKMKKKCFASNFW